MKKILFITRGIDLDYLNDTIFHGLTQLPETEVFILNENNYDFMFRDLTSAESRSKLYGKGFTMTNLIPAEKKKVHTPAEAEEKIQQHFYDYIIYGSIFRCDLLLDKVRRYYQRNEILLCDGEDEDFHFRLTRGCRYRFFQLMRAKRLAKIGLYYKRELRSCLADIFRPVSFAIPAELVLPQIPAVKNRKKAQIIPGNLKTYIYKDQESYYRGYQEASFGITFKKMGWDCLRHYEILANGCIPYFPDIEKKPVSTMIFFPVNLIRYTNRLYERDEFQQQYARISAYLLDYTSKFLTTRFMAEYLLNSAADSRKI